MSPSPLPLKFQGRDPIIPLDSLILVTGANGYVASHISDQLLLAGYRVRGTTRDASKAQWLHELFDARYGKGRFESVVVEDMASSPEAFDEAVKGVKGVCHVATVVSFSGDPHAVVPATIAGARNAAAAAAKEKGIVRFVYTSSSVAITIPKPDKKFTISTNDWNDEDVEAAWKPGPYGPERALPVYAASKTQAEQAMWNFVKEEKPSFTLNTVLPNANFGTPLNDKVHLSTGDWVRQAYKGDLGPLKSFPPQWMVNVQDTARVHVAALLAPDVQNERILAFAYRYNVNDVLAALRKAFPGKEFPADEPNAQRDLSELDNSRGADLLRAFGREGWTGLEQSVKENCVGM